MQDNSIKKILHTSFMASSGNGLYYQLRDELKAAENLGLNWDILLVTKSIIQDNFIIQIPKILSKTFFLKRLFYHFHLIKKIRKNKYDYILFRYVKSDLFSYLFQYFYKNRITIHHSKETDEILLNSNFTNKVFYFIDNYFGRKFIGKSNGIICLTNDILDYELERINTNIPNIVISNGIDIQNVGLKKDKRDPLIINIAFIASNFLPWHGLDRLIEIIHKSQNLKYFHLHLIGKIDVSNLNRINEIESTNYKIFQYGFLHRDEFLSIIEKCDIGIDSLALDRKNMTEACALKVREYLANGLPVYSCFKDAGLPDNFPFYKVGSLDLDSIVNYALDMKKISREEVRNASVPYIDKTILIKKLYDFIQIIDKSNN